MVSSAIQADEKEIEVLFTSKTLTPEAALIVSQAALESCRKAGLQVSVAVVDGGGNIQVVLRDKLAGISSPDAAILKAKTSINFRSATTALSEAVNSNSEASGIKQLPGILVLGGGVTIQASGSMVGAVGVAGAPDGKSDEKCAQAGIEAILEQLEFAE
ncbi:MAG: heme-binding protein [Gammaproteobacteria bacterium]|nr:heme-binding protein [Gammaproteobacteria bacterium]